MPGRFSLPYRCPATPWWSLTAPRRAARLRAVALKVVASGGAGEEFALAGQAIGVGTKDQS